MRSQTGVISAVVNFTRKSQSWQQIRFSDWNDNLRNISQKFQIIWWTSTINQHPTKVGHKYTTKNTTGNKTFTEFTRQFWAWNRKVDFFYEIELSRETQSTLCRRIVRIFARLDRLLEFHNNQVHKMFFLKIQPLRLDRHRHHLHCLFTAAKAAVHHFWSFISCLAISRQSGTTE